MNQRLQRMDHALEAEIGLICSCWADEENTRTLLGNLTTKDFHTSSARFQMEVLTESWKRYRDVSPMSLRKVSAEMGGPYLDSYSIVLDAYMGDLGRGVGAGQMRARMEQVTEETTRHNYLKALSSAQEAIQDRGLTLAEAQANVSSLLTQASFSRRQAAEHWTDGLGKLAAEVRERLRLEAEGKPVGRIMKTGIDTVDDILGGIEESDYVVVAARTGVGKTAFSLGVASHIAASYGSVLFCSLELSRPKMWRRVAVQQSQNPLSVVERRPDLIEQAQALNTNLWIDDSPLKPHQLQQRIELFRVEHPDLCCVFVDHLGIFAAPPRRFEETSTASNTIRDVMKATGVPIVALVQIGRKAELRQDNRPTSADLRMSGDIEQDARKIILLHRPPLYRPAGQGDPFEAVAIVAKNGEGATGDAAMRYNGPLFTFMAGYSDRPDSEAPSFQTHNAPDFEDLDMDGIY